MYVNEFIKHTYRVKDRETRGGYICLDMNENPDGLPGDFVEEVLSKMTPTFLASYPDKKNLLHLIAQKENVNIENISLTNGSDEGMRLAFETFTKPGSTLVTVAPTFEMYQVYASMFGLHHEKVLFDDGFSIDVEQILSVIQPGVSIVVLLHPNSPIGVTFSENDFRRIILAASEVGAVVLIDEAYYPFGTDTKIEYCKQYSNVLILRTFSKLCSLAALRVGYLVGDTEAIHFIENAQSTYNVNSVGILFAEELLKRDDILKNLKENVDCGRNYLVSKLEEHRYCYFAKSGNYILIRPNLPSHELAQMLKEKRILVKTYKNGNLQEWIRVTLGSKEIMEVFWKCFCEIDL